MNNADTSNRSAGGPGGDPVAEAMLNRAVRDYPESPAVDDLLAEAGVSGAEAEGLATAAIAYAALLHA